MSVEKIRDLWDDITRFDGKSTPAVSNQVCADVGLLPWVARMLISYPQESMSRIMAELGAAKL